MLKPGKRAREIISAFFVKKKGNRIRLVLDCRACNQRVKVPVKTRMGSATALAQLSLGETDQMRIPSSDLQDCFYQLSIVELCAWFAYEQPHSAAQRLSDG